MRRSAKEHRMDGARAKMKPILYFVFCALVGLSISFIFSNTAVVMLVAAIAGFAMGAGYVYMEKQQR